MSNALIDSNIPCCQRSLRKWGQANNVIFDASKDQHIVNSTTDPSGGPAKVLGIDFDNKLIMNTTAHTCKIKAACKTRSILRVRRFYSVSNLLLLHKSHVLSCVEYRTAGLHFVSTSVLNEIDGVQSRFLRQLKVFEESAFAHFNLAPLNVRRDISILGSIHRASLNLGPPLLWKFFRAEA